MGVASSNWLEPWVREWGDKLTQLAYVLTHDRELAQDIVQEAFIRLYHQHQTHPEAPISVAWLYTVTRNLARDALRKRRRRPEVAFDTPLPPIAAGQRDQDTVLAVQQVLARLSRTDQECLWLFYYGDFSMKQIANALHLTQAAVRARLHRARRHFADLWEEE